jgi:hypothetical protein
MKNRGRLLVLPAMVVTEMLRKRRPPTVEPTLIIDQKGEIRE